MIGSIGVFVATMTGTAELCADEIEAALRGLGLRVERRLMDGLGADALKAHDQVVIVSSTYGHGEIPDNGQSFFNAIEAAEGLKGLRYAVFGLGDMTYAATFCAAGRKWDELFARKGALRIAPLKQHDAAAGELAEDVAGAWASSLQTALLEAA